MYEFEYMQKLTDLLQVVHDTNKDKIKELKKEQKKYKTDKKKKQIAEEIQRLEKMEV